MVRLKVAAPYDETHSVNEMRWLSVGFLFAAGCGGSFDTTSGDPGSSLGGDLGDELPGGAPPVEAIGGSAPSKIGGSSSVGGSKQEESGGSNSGGSAIGGESSDGGYSSGGATAGGSSSGGSGTGGSTQEPTVIWAGSYEGESIAFPGDKKAQARLYLAGEYDCPFDAGFFEPGDFGTFYSPFTPDLTCADASKTPVALFYPMEWDMPALPSIDWSADDLEMRFVLHEFSASPWPATSETEVWVSFEWQLTRIGD